MEDKDFECIHSGEKKKRRMKKSEEGWCNLWYNTKRNNLWVTEEEGKRAASLFKEIIAERFPKLRGELDIQVYEANGSPNKLNLKRASPRHIMTNLSEIRESKAARENMLVIFKGTHTSLPMDFSAEIL